MLVGGPVLEAVIAKLGLVQDLETLRTNITVNPVKDTQLIRLSVVDNDTTRAALIANTIAEIFISNVKTLLEKPYTDRIASMRQQLDNLSNQTAETQAEIAALTSSNGQVDTELMRQETLLADQRSDYQTFKDDYDQLNLATADAAEVVTITEPAQVPKKPTEKNLVLYIIIAALVGAFLAMGFTFLLEGMNDNIRTAEDVNRLLGLPVLGTISQMPRKDQRPVIISQPLSPNAEAFPFSANLRYSVEYPYIPW
jgi:capsular polysaccharide biosynthesis protein